MEKEYATWPRRRVGMVPKNDLGTGGDILEAYLALTANKVLGNAAHVAGRLVRETRQGGTLGLCLHDAGKRAVDEQGVIDRARRRRELAHGYTRRGAKVHLGARLHHPPGLGQLGVDGLPCPVFGMKNAILPAYHR